MEVIRHNREWNDQIMEVVTHSREWNDHSMEVFKLMALGLENNI